MAGVMADDTSPRATPAPGSPGEAAQRGGPELLPALRRLPILMLHHVEPTPLEPPAVHPGSYLTPERLGRLLDLVDRRGRATLTLAEAVERAREGRSLGRRLVLTFDDGCRCFAEHALPMLRARGHTATLYAVAGELGGINRWDLGSGTKEGGDPPERREEMLDIAGLERVAEAGIEVGCHGWSHARLNQCGTSELLRETAGARRALENALGRPVTTFCYPYGHSGPRVREAVRAAGFRAAVGIEDHPGTRAGDPYGLPRTAVGPSDSSFELQLKITGLYRFWRRLPKLGLLARLRGERR